MAKAALDTLIHDLQRIAGVDALRDHTDADLLARFIAQRDEAAFTAIVMRHGGVVFGLCKRMLPTEQDAEDAFQATFLILARKAGTIGTKEALAAWLYRVAHRIALRARTKMPSVVHDAGLIEQIPARTGGDPMADRDVLRVLDDEIARLPASSARAIILCYFEGKTHEEAARTLGCPTGTLASWIARARQQLRDRLTRRGCGLSVAALGTLLAAQASAAPTIWIRPTCQAAFAFVAGSAATGSTKAILLAEGALHMMWLSKLKTYAILALALAFLGLGAGSVALNVWGHGPDAPIAAVSPDQGDAQAEIAKLRAEIAKLRAELKDAVKQIKSLQDALPDNAASATYRGKPASFWLAQLKDADPKFRVEAVEAVGSLAQMDEKLTPILLHVVKTDPVDSVALASVKAIGTLAQRQKPLVPVLMQLSKESPYLSVKYGAVDAICKLARKDNKLSPLLFQLLNDDSVASMVTETLGAIGPEGLPELIVIAKNKALDWPKLQRMRAIQAIGMMNVKAKPAVPALAQILKEPPSIGTCRLTLRALESIGPDAKEAIPALVELLELTLRDAGKMKNKKGIRTKNAENLEKEENSFFGLGNNDINVMALRTLTTIEPSVREITPNQFTLGINIGGGGGPARYEEAWRKLVDVMKKKYAPTK